MSVPHGGWDAPLPLDAEIGTPASTYRGRYHPMRDTYSEPHDNYLSYEEEPDEEENALGYLAGREAVGYYLKPPSGNKEPLLELGPCGDDIGGPADEEAVGHGGDDDGAADGGTPWRIPAFVEHDHVGEHPQSLDGVGSKAYMSY